MGATCGCMQHINILHTYVHPHVENSGQSWKTKERYRNETEMKKDVETILCLTNGKDKLLIFWLLRNGAAFKDN